ncbi:hypothetical protein DFJ63DRAFT_334750 [Scheffersomyces coipomensis]|uniref:uncharacterized protein n=1 Tax=Scheffersomyces coipomensis TaxID=1788519 RepID=UPI00315CC61B
MSDQSMSSLQVPATSTVKPPQTPRSTSTTNNSFLASGSHHKHHQSITPSFTFGLNFSPSFQFQSPIHSVSPQKFFNVANNLNKAITGSTLSKKLTTTATTTATTPSINNKDKQPPITVTVTTPSRLANRFMDSLRRTKSEVDTSIGSDLAEIDNESVDDSIRTQDDSLSLFSGTFVNDSINASVSHPNLTSLSSIYEDDDVKEGVVQNPTSDDNTFLTPNKLILAVENNNNINNNNNNQTPSRFTATMSLASAPALVPIKPKIDNNATDAIRNSIKRRKLSAVAERNIQDSPNNSIASQIDSTVDSPIQKRKLSIDSVNTSADSGDKVWYDELDEVLIKSFLKYRNFRENQKGYHLSSVLKNTSQNKVLSRMIFNKTGILRTSKQISSRLFRLSKQNRLDKQKSSAPSFTSSMEISLNDEFSDLMQTPLDDFISNSQLHGSGSMSGSTGNLNDSMDSIKTNEIIDQELYALLSSPPNELLDESIQCSLRLQDLKIQFINHSNSSDNHTFAKLNKISHSSLPLISAPSKFNQHLIQPDLLLRLNQSAVPIWYLTHDININITTSHQLVTSTPISPFNNQVQPQLSNNQSFNLLNGVFESFMKIEIEANSNTQQSMLSWKSYTKIFSNNKEVLLENVEIVNAYSDLLGQKYNLQYPLLKSFFAGYLNFLINGSFKNGVDNLTIVQVLYQNNNDDVKFDQSNSTIYGCFIHNVKFNQSNSPGSIDLEIINLTDKAVLETNQTPENVNDSQIQIQIPKEQHEEDDDNETIMADSSPYKPSPRTDLRESPTKGPGPNFLSIDMDKVHAVGNIDGPHTAPIYNADIVHKYNKNMLKQQEQLRIQIKNHQHQQGYVNEGQGEPPHSAPGVMNQGFPLQLGQSQLQPQAPMTAPIEQKSAFMSMPMNSNPQFIQQPFVQQQQPQHQQQQQQQQQQQLMVNLGSGFVPFASLHPTLQEQFMSAHRQLEMQRQGQQQYMLQQQQQQQLFMNDISGQAQYYSAPQQPMLQQVPVQQPQVQQPQRALPVVAANKFPIISRNSSTTSISSTKDSNKENIKPKEIKFGPILEYDPSKDSKSIQQSKTSKQANGVHRFPINTPVSIYKPKKSK